MNDSENKKKRYFTKDTEAAVVKYANTTDQNVKQDLYIVHIQPAFNELIEKIVFTYKFSHLADLDSLKDECKLYLVSILSNFDPNKGSKAFSYFTIVTKNWFSYKCKKQAKKRCIEIEINDLPYDLQNEKTVTYNPYLKDREDAEFWYLLLSSISEWKKYYRGNDLKIICAIEELLAQKEEIEIFNKKAIYLYIREITGLNTKQITNGLKKIRKKYYEFRTEWQKGKY
jgi:hypothetical protein